MYLFIRHFKPSANFWKVPKITLSYLVKQGSQIPGKCRTTIFPLLILLLGFTPIISLAESGNALSFDGVNDKVEIVDKSNLDLTINYTLECWIKPERFTPLAGLISKYQMPNANGYFLRLSGTTAATGLNFDGMKTQDGILTAGKWYHIAAVNDNGTRHLYVNGSEIPLSGTPFFILSNDNMLTLGVDYEAAPRYFHGAMDEVRIWNVPRSASELATNMKTVIDPATTGLVAYYRFNQGTSDADNSGILTVTDLTANNNYGTALNFNLNGGSSNWVEGVLPENRLYVDAAASGQNTGGDWADGYNSLMDALTFAASHPAVDSILVAEGVYQPAQYARYYMIDGVQILGSYPTGGGIRNVLQHSSILKGHDESVIRNDGNSLTATAILDGFVITGGSASVGAGMFNLDCGSPVIRNCIFRGNNASIYGGGVENYKTGTIVFENCIFWANTASYGGGVDNGHGSTPEFINCTIYGNSASSAGGGVNNINAGTLAQFTNCIIYGNNTGVSNTNGGACNITYSDVQGGFAGTGNMEEDPAFVNPVNGDFSLPSSSPVIDAGDKSALAPFVPDLATALDLAGETRIVANKVDMGAQEYQGDIATPVKLSRFTGKVIGDAVTLEWQTALEEEPRTFEVQVANLTGDASGLDPNTKWSTLWQTSAMGQQGGHIYHYQTVQLVPTAYYRLKMTNQQGEVNYSKILSLTISQNPATEIKVFPNPANNFLQVYVIHSGLLKIFDTGGRCIFQQNLQPGTHKIDLLSLKISHGVYYVLFNKSKLSFIKQ